MPPRRGMKYLKANCHGCMGLKNGSCIFRIPIERLTDPTTGNTIIKPMRPCNKPRTRKKLQEALAARVIDKTENPPYLSPMGR